MLILALALPTSVAQAQTADEHAAHHPGGRSLPMPKSTPAMPMGGNQKPNSGGMAMPAKPNEKTGAKPMAGSTPMPAGGMGDMRSKMMGGMGGEREKPLYPSLMDVPKMTPAKRAEVEKAAHERMRQSLARISSATVRLADASSRNDDAAMQEATADLREATAQFESGVAASRALKEGRDPQSVALQWFKREMNLLPPMDAETAHNELGLPPRWFHYLTIAFLGSIVVVMIGMYFFKMRRASMLFGRIEADKGGSPPGSAPELAGGKPPSEDKPDAPADKPAAMPPIVSEMESPPPLTANWRGQLRVGSIATETPSVKTLRLLPLFGERLPFTFIPG